MPSEPISILKKRSKLSRPRPIVPTPVPNCPVLQESKKQPDVKNLRVKFDLPIDEYEICCKPAYKVGVKSIMDSNAIALALRSPNIQDEILIRFLDQLGQHISVFDKKNEKLVEILLDLDWSRKSDPVIHSYCEVMLNLVTAYTFYTKSVIKMIVQGFTPTLQLDEKINIADMKFEKLHDLLQRILKLVPSSSMQITPILSDKFPYMKKSLLVQQCYVKNCLEITKYAETLRKPILNLIISKMIQLDVHCPKTDIEEAQTAAELDEEEKNKSEIFTMETDEPSEENRDETKHPLARTLDTLLEEIYDYINFVCWSEVDGVRTTLDWDATKKLYKDFLTIFDSVVLPTHASAHVQFVMFYICSFRHQLFEGFVDYLWKRVTNPNEATIVRQVSICYLGSFVCRAAYVNISVVKDLLTLMCNWLHGYMGNLTGSSKNLPDSNYHGTFYAISQVVFYVIAFRHKEIVELKDGLSFLQSLNLERLVTCSLNPLKVCLPSVVTNFASVARNYQIAYCYTVIEKNNRMRLPIASETGAVYSSFSTLDTFFPFDPYLLKKSGLKIKPLYRVYAGSLETDADEDLEEEEEDDFIQDLPLGTTPTSPNNISDVLSYGSSPGFKYSPKSR